MVYIKMTQPVKSFDIVRIKEFHLFDTDDATKTPISVGFRYQVCQDTGDKFVEEYNKFITIDDQEVVSKLFQKQQANRSFYDNVCMVLLQYLVDKSIESGTIEVK